MLVNMQMIRGTVETASSAAAHGNHAAAITATDTAFDVLSTAFRQAPAGSATRGAFGNALADVRRAVVVIPNHLEKAEASLLGALRHLE